ncbi:2Fe-2S iron-sulfur cluster-binding protein [Phenylobacterium sp.]|jgi:2Fe-2S ferredoxin|uniref:2Fe-2S iron-sulfur cluster-binding protein n=1 Tax=Phenylobacterium sp. TaxID=1871053 RepID=UPI002E33D9E5|nr:2Fe-2S iron-sulfur cluster-binding protein [Phenylobacterium sp.]HEX3364637.1 2Fe-2S iron-sulfur cluster-binding protein [Phenylobacterium sp.]
MVKVVFNREDGGRCEIEAPLDASIMQAARDNGIAGVTGECGGFAACGTCHVYVDAAWTSRLPPPTAAELAMLEVVVSPQDNSRLSCQIQLAHDLDGIVLGLPPSQY